MLFNANCAFLPVGKPFNSKSKSTFSHFFRLEGINADTAIQGVFSFTVLKHRSMSKATATAPTVCVGKASALFSSTRNSSSEKQTKAVEDYLWLQYWDIRRKPRTKLLTKLTS